MNHDVAADLDPFSDLDPLSDQEARRPVGLAEGHSRTLAAEAPDSSLASPADRSDSSSASSTRTARNPLAPSDRGMAPVHHAIDEVLALEPKRLARWRTAGLQASPDRVMYSP